VLVKTEAGDKCPVHPDPYVPTAHFVGEKQDLERLFYFRVEGNDQRVLFNFSGVRDSFRQEPDLVDADIIPIPGVLWEQVSPGPRKRERFSFVLRRFCPRLLLKQPPFLAVAGGNQRVVVL
jgi:hypothetical protein